MIAAIAEQAEISKKDAEKALKAFVDVVTEQLKEGEESTVSRIRYFEVSERAAREGRNPQTGKTMKDRSLQSSEITKLEKALKDAVNA